MKTQVWLNGKWGKVDLPGKSPMQLLHELNVTVEKMVKEEYSGVSNAMKPLMFDKEMMKDEEFRMFVERQIFYNDMFLGIIKTVGAIGLVVFLLFLFGGQ